jgi:Chitin binding Peritrophin-A domain
LISAVVGFKCPDKVDPGSISAKFNPFPRFNIGECGRLVTCVNGYPRIVSCGEGKVVNDESLTCDDPEYSPRW